MTPPVRIWLFLIVGLFFTPARTPGQTRTALVEVAFSEKLGPLHMERMALGQGGLSDMPMWENRIAEIRGLHPALIRLFIQEYFNLLPAQGQYHFESLDRSVDTILQ